MGHKTKTSPYGYEAQNYVWQRVFRKWGRRVKARVIAYERQSLRTGKSGDWSSWAVKSTAEVTQAWEFPNFDSSGAVLIIVVGGNQKSGLKTVANTQAVKDFLLKVAPLQMVVVCQRAGAEWCAVGAQRCGG